jgi:hypothetical protein
MLETNTSASRQIASRRPSTMTVSRRTAAESSAMLGAMLTQAVPSTMQQKMGTFLFSGRPEGEKRNVPDLSPIYAKTGMSPFFR